MSLPPDIRVATREDRPEFLRLWRGLLESERAGGSPYHASEHNLQKFREVFEAYCSGSLNGFTLLWTPPGEPSPRGILMGGEPWTPEEMDTDFGRPAILWGVFVEPAYRGQGTGLKLEFAAFGIGRTRGYDSVRTAVRDCNPHGDRMASGFGVRPYATQHWVRLVDVKEPPDGVR